MLFNFSISTKKFSIGDLIVISFAAFCVYVTMITAGNISFSVCVGKFVVLLLSDF